MNIRTEDVHQRTLPQREISPSRQFFMTCNFANFAATDKAGACRRHLKEIENTLSHFVVGEGKEAEGAFVQFAMFWQEIGQETGNMHWHGIVKIGPKKMRPLQFKNWFCQLFEEDWPEPRVEKCRSLKAAIEYRDEAGKAEAWQAYRENAGINDPQQEGYDPAFFVLIQLA